MLAPTIATLSKALFDSQTKRIIERRLLIFVRGISSMSSKSHGLLLVGNFETRLQRESCPTTASCQA